PRIDCTFTTENKSNDWHPWLSFVGWILATDPWLIFHIISFSHPGRSIRLTFPGFRGQRQALRLPSGKIVCYQQRVADRWHREVGNTFRYRYRQGWKNFRCR